MTRALLTVAVLSFVAALACAIAVRAAGPVNWHNWNWTIDSDDYGHGPPVDGGGPAETRQLTWTGGDTLQVQVPADVTYTQGPAGPISVTGPKGTVEAMVVDDGRLKFDRRVHNAGRLQIVMSAPDVREFHLAGVQALTIKGYDQDRFELHIAGSGRATAQGHARTVEVHAAGSSDVDLGGLPSDDAEVHIAGSGRTTLAPRDHAEIHIAGSGEVNLATEPRNIETHIAGSGRIVHEAPAPAAAPAPPVPPAPPAKASRTSLQAA